MRMALYILAVAACALLLHLTLGWAWTLGAGVLAGLFVPKRGWLVGTLGVTLNWAVLITYNYVVAPAATQAMVDTMGGIIGNTPGMAVVAGTLSIGMLLGGLGGGVGTFARQMLRPAR
jgi:hypothetical protein